MDTVVDRAVVVISELVRRLVDVLDRTDRAVVVLTGSDVVVVVVVVVGGVVVSCTM